MAAFSQYVERIRTYLGSEGIVERTVSPISDSAQEPGNRDTYCICCSLFHGGPELEGEMPTSLKKRSFTVLNANIDYERLGSLPSLKPPV